MNRPPTAPRFVRPFGFGRAPGATARRRAVGRLPLRPFGLLPRRFPGAGSRPTSPPAPGTMAARGLPEAHLPAWHVDFQLPARGLMGYFPL